jgi:hypothetical protein
MESSTDLGSIGHWDRVSVPASGKVNEKAKLNLEQKRDSKRGIEMKHIIWLILIMLAALTAGCRRDKDFSQSNHVSITGSGNIVSREIAVAEFDQIEAGLHFNLAVHQGEEFSVVLFSDDNFIDFIQVEKLGTTISFGLKPGYAYNIFGATMNAEVTMPELAALELSGSSHAELAGFTSMENFQAELTGSSSLSGKLEAETASFNVYGNAYVKMAGSSEKLWLDGCGNSVIDLGEFRAEDATLDLACASTAAVNVDGRLDVEAAQKSSVTYVDHPVSGDMRAHENASIRLK